MSDQHAGLRAGMHGPAPLSARLPAWLAELVADPERCQELLTEFGSPVNVLQPDALARNGAELVDAGTAAGVRVRPFFARKANKAICFVDAALAAGFGVDVASLAELQQVLDRGARGDDVVVSAAIKPVALLELAIEAGAFISVDNLTELDQIAAAGSRLGRRPMICPRLAIDPAKVAPTRFGERLAVWLAELGALREAGEVRGVHVHLHGYAARDRVHALGEVLTLVDALRAVGSPIEFVDLGGGVPMSYLDDQQQWDAFWAAHQAALAADEPFTWQGNPLDNVYPYWQRPVRGEWLAELLATPLPDGKLASRAITERGLEFRLEPGRSLLDGCGTTLAQVMFTKRRSDGVGLVGLAMNRTQCRTTSDDYLVDPLLVRTQPAGQRFEGYLVGAYCIEAELIMARRMVFPAGVAAGDIVAIPNTAGYFMHILESASHQLPLAKNVVASASGFELDAIDR